ncbi:MAG: cytochrome c family protein [Rhizobiaceae bacterium]
MKSAESLLVIFIAAASAFALFVLGTLVIKGPTSRDGAVTLTQGAGVPAPGSAAPAGEIAPSEPVVIAPAAPTEVTNAGMPDPDRGGKVFAKCKACHLTDEGGANRVGPNLWGVFGRTVASTPGFAYSEALAALSGQAWDAAFLDAYLADPRKAVPGNKMAFAGLKDPGDRHDVIAYLARQGGTPVPPEDLQLPAAGAGQSASATPRTPAGGENPDATAGAEELPPAIDPAPRSAEEAAAIAARAETLRQEAAGLDYERARYHPIHNAPLIEKASNEECLVCHAEILEHRPRQTSPAGLDAVETLAWYQTLDTYEGEQQTFHWRHVESPLARTVMNLSCNFCHRGGDPREESPAMMPGKPAFTAVNAATSPFTARKMVNPSTTCLLCHGQMPDPVNIMGLGAPWHEARADLESDDAPNGCLTCHGELFRTVRHRVTYLNAASIEAMAAESSDVCFGCHGGRTWYRIAYPYPRHPWPGMDPAIPEWAAGRPAQSDPAYQLPQDTK